MKPYAKAMQGSYQQMKTGRQVRAFVALTVVAALALASATPAFPHGPANPRWFRPDQTWHFGAAGAHGGGRLFCDYGGGRVWVGAPLAPTATHWRYSLQRWSGTQWEAYPPVSGWYGTPQPNTAALHSQLPSGYYRVLYRVVWNSTMADSALMEAYEYWQGTNGTGWAGGSNEPYCQV